MYETYIKVKGEWCYYYRAADKLGKTFDFMLSEKRDEAAAITFSNALSAKTAFQTGS